MVARRNRSRPQQLNRVLAACFGITAALTLGGCTVFSEYVNNGFKLGPNYSPPPVTLPEIWIDRADPQVSVGTPNLACWWEVFGDPVLAQLIQRSYSSNLTLRAAGFQILASQQQRRIAASELLPQSQSASASYLHAQVSNTGGASGGVISFFGSGLTPPTSPPPVTEPSTPIAGMVDPGTVPPRTRA